MAEITHFKKVDDGTTRTHTGDSNYTEVSQYTVSWEDLTGAGFANSDEVIVIVRLSLTGSNSGGYFTTKFYQGSTFGGAAELSFSAYQPNTHGTAANGACEACHVEKVTLSTDDDFYTGIRTSTSGYTVSANDFSFLIMKLGDLAADDWRYTEHTTTGDAPATDTDGASVTLPSASGDDWLAVASVTWEIDSTSIMSNHRLVLDSASQQSLNFEGKGTFEEYTSGLVGYAAAASSSAVCKVVYSNDSTGTVNDYTRSAIFCLRLGAFESADGNYDGTTSYNVNSTGLTWVETHQLATFSLISTGNLCYFAQTAYEVNQGSTCSPKQRVQHDGTDFITGYPNFGMLGNENNAIQGYTGFGVKSVSSGTLDIEVDNNNNVNSSLLDWVDHTLVAFSMELAGAGGTIPTSIFTNANKVIN